MEEIEFKNNMFDGIKPIDEMGNEYWLARELQITLEYKQWRKFETVIKEAMNECVNSGYSIVDHSASVGKMIDIGSKTNRLITDYKLSRYACFAIQTRKMELLEKDYNLLTEDEKRFYQRNLTRKGNLSLNITTKKAGVKTLTNFIMLVIVDYIMVKQPMTLLEEKDFDIVKIY